MPVPVQKVFGTALRDVQYGENPEIAKSLSGFGSASVRELVEDYDRGTFRAVYTVALPGAIYVLHVFQKKSKRGIKTPQADVQLISSRLKLAREHYDVVNREEDYHG